MVDLALLKNYSDIKKAGAGTVLINDGDTMGDQMYIILTGAAGVYKNYGKPSEVFICKLSPGEFFGETTLFLHKSRNADVIALEELTVLEITRDNAYHLFQESPAVTYSFIQSLCERIESLNQTILNLNAQLYPDLHAKEEEVPASAVEPKQETEPEIPAAAAAPLSSSLFPDGHHSYLLPSAAPNQSLLLDDAFTCPMCENKFRFPSVRTSKLKTLSTDGDLRVHYDGIELTHYLAVTCPDCLFSAIATEFNKAMSGRKKFVADAIQEYKKELDTDFAGIDANTIFARLYLALECMPLCYTSSIVYTARLWLNISWLYKDCGDENMEKYAIGKALEAYDKVFTTVRLDRKNEQRICIIIGELYYKMQDYENARKYFYMAKTNREGVQQLVVQAEDRINDVKKAAK